MLTRRIFNVSPWDYRDVFGELERLRRLMDGPVGAGVFPLIDVTEDEDNYYVRAELPGIRGEDLEITAVGNGLTLAGTRKIASEGENVKYHRKEREAGRFSRKFELPGGIDTEKVAAGFENGILTVKLPKAEASKPRRISVE